MSPRPRTVDDAAIFAAVARLGGQVGPARLTLALVAREVGLSPATLVQRFGSKRKLLVAFARSGLGGNDAFVAGLRARHRRPLATLRAFLACFAGMASSPREMANHLAFFQQDVTDPTLRKITHRMLSDHEATIGGLLREAIDAGELEPCDPPRLAPILLTVATGTLLRWAIDRSGTAPDRLTEAVDLVLRPYLPSTTSRRGRS